MRIESLRLQNYRGFEDATLPLDRPLTVLFGENGSGKSSVLTALAICFTELLSDSFKRHGVGIGFAASDDDVRFGAKATEISLSIRHDERVFSPRLVLVRQRQSDVLSFKPLSDQLAWEKAAFLPIVYLADRSVERSRDVFWSTDDTTKASYEAQWALADSLDPGHIGFRSFFRWFREREDAENRLKVEQNDLTLKDRQLSAVRTALESLLIGFTNPRIRQDPLRLEVTKQGQRFSIDQLSDGEKQVLVMTADIARRLSMVYPKKPKPLEQEAVILVDEVELHLHPSWQRQILPAWRRVFPNCQFIVTTHSPQVISEVPNDAVYVIKNFQFYRPGAPTEGRDSNSILEEVMGTPERPQDVKEELEKIAALIDNERYADAHKHLDVIAERLTESDNEIVRLRVLLHFMEGSHAAGSQK